MSNLFRTMQVYWEYINIPRKATYFLIIPLFLMTFSVGSLFIEHVQTNAATQRMPSQTVYQVVNQKTGVSLLTPYYNEAESAKSKYGFTSSSLLFTASVNPSSGLVPIYRLYNPKSGDFMVTQWPTEKSGAIQKYGYQDNGVSFYASRTRTGGTVPLYKFLKGSLHRYAVTASEVAQLESTGWKKEGIAFYVWPVQAKSASRSVPSTPTPTSTSSPTPTPTPAATSTPPPTTTPTPSSSTAINGEMIQWSSVARPGESLHTVLMKPAVRGKILKLPAGIFEVSNFRDGYKAINIPSDVKGLVGSGRDTIIRMKTRTSTYGSTVPVQSQGGTNQLYIMRMNDGTQPQVLADFWLQGTEQGHLYNGIMVGKSQPGTTVQNIFVTGIPGNYHENPGETFGLTYWRGSRSITRNVEVDGRRVTGDSYAQRSYGASVGASGLSFSRHDYARVYDTYIHDHRYGMPTFWISNYGQTWNLQSVRNRIGINHEYSFNTVHHQPVMHGSHTRRHITFLANDRDGALTIIGATNDEWINSSTSGPIGKGKKMLVLTSNSYRSANDNSITTPPTILLDDGKTKAPYLWAH